MARSKAEKEFRRTLKQLREESESARKSSSRGGIVVAIVGGLALLGVPLVSALVPQAEAPPTYACIESYDRAIEMIEQDGVYVALPEGTVEETQCDVNGRMMELYDLEEGRTTWEITP